jgi:hypothetical protein
MNSIGIIRYICARSLAALTVFSLVLVLPTTEARAGQTINTTSTTSCSALGGSVTGANFLTDFSNGTFGSESGAADQSPSINPYPGQVSSGIFSNFYAITWGRYAYVANAVTRRNPSQHPGITDPVYGNTGRFFASDPDVNTPVIGFTALNVIPNQNYQLSFWAANSEPAGLPNNINIEIDGIVSLNTGPLQAFASALEWKRYSFVFNAGNRTTILIAIRSLETGNGGRDFYLDNVEMRQCSITGGNISGFVYSDDNRNNSYQSAVENPLSPITIRLYDTRGDANAANDIFVSSYTTGVNGAYSFTNVPPNVNYQLRVDTADPDLPFGAVAGTPATVNVSLASGGNITNQNFGFDVPPPILSMVKTSRPYTSLLTGVFSVPGQDMEYTIQILNSGGSGYDKNSLFMFDTLPTTLEFYNGDFDDAGTATTDPILFSQTNAGLNYVYSRDVAYSNSATAPTSMASCGYTPIAGYDANVKHICVSPDGVFAGSAALPSMTLKFRSRIK